MLSAECLHSAFNIRQFSGSYLSSRTQMLRKLIGGLGSPWAWSLIGAESYFLYTGLPMYSVSPLSSKWFCTSTPLWNTVTYAGVLTDPSALNVGAVQTTS